MRVMDAIRSAEDAMRGREGFFLCSCFVSLKEFSEPDEWTVLFYNPKSGNLIECTCSESGTEASAETKAMSKIDRLEKGMIKKDESYAIEKIRHDISGKPMNILVSLHMKDGAAVWTMSAVMQTLSVIIYDINAETGDIIRKDITGLVRKV